MISSPSILYGLFPEAAEKGTYYSWYSLEAFRGPYCWRLDWPLKLLVYLSLLRLPFLMHPLLRLTLNSTCPLNPDCQRQDCSEFHTGLIRLRTEQLSLHVYEPVAKGGERHSFAWLEARQGQLFTALHVSPECWHAKQGFHASEY